MSTSMVALLERRPKTHIASNRHLVRPAMHTVSWVRGLVRMDCCVMDMMSSRGESGAGCGPRLAPVGVERYHEYGVCQSSESKSIRIEITRPAALFHRLG